MIHILTEVYQSGIMTFINKIDKIMPRSVRIDVINNDEKNYLHFEFMDKNLEKVEEIAESLGIKFCEFTQRKPKRMEGQVYGINAKKVNDQDLRNLLNKELKGIRFDNHALNLVQ